MSDNSSDRWCVLLPCADNEHWAIPQVCLAEIVTLQDAGNQPPGVLQWRGVEVPVCDFGVGGNTAWRDPRAGTGLIAVVLGVRNEGCDFWSVALRGDGVAIRNLGQVSLQDCPAEARDYATAAFRLDDTLYQVPDLLRLQREMAASHTQRQQEPA